MSAGTSQSTSASPRASAAIQLARHLVAKVGGDQRDHLASYIGFTGGDHILRDKSGRAWCVDLVTGTCMLCAGLMPSEWKHPPRLVA